MVELYVKSSTFFSSPPDSTSSLNSSALELCVFPISVLVLMLDVTVLEGKGFMVFMPPATPLRLHVLLVGSGPKANMFIPSE